MIDHRWDVSPRQAIAIQERLRHQVETADRFGAIKFVAGVDVGFEDDGRTTRAAVVVLGAQDLKLLDSAVVRRKTRFPYVPGLLSFREIPAVLDALGKLKIQPDLLLCDGQGYAHPRRMGFASHLGLVSGIPSIGVAKSRLIGEHGAVPARKGGWAPLVDKGEVIGAVLRTRAGVNPLFVSCGHRVSLETAISWTLRATTRYRLPETTRLAHRLASG